MASAVVWWPCWGTRRPETESGRSVQTQRQWTVWTDHAAFLLCRCCSGRHCSLGDDGTPQTWHCRSRIASLSASPFRRLIQCAVPTQYANMPRMRIWSEELPSLWFHSRAHHALSEVWQAEWDGCSANKLHSIKPHLGYCSVIRLSRHDAVIVRRLCIGHTLVTHRYLLTGDSQPLCDKCKCSLTVKHILLSKGCPWKVLHVQFAYLRMLMQQQSWMLSKKSTFIILFSDIGFCFHFTLAIGACFYLAFYTIRFYHLLYAIACKLISFSQYPTWMALYSLIVVLRWVSIPVCNWLLLIYK